MDLTREQALKLHREMWSDMQKKFGDKPSEASRIYFKEEWCKEHFPDEKILAHCFLCEYTADENGKGDCHRCPILWGSEKNRATYYCASRENDYMSVPISQILALPEREVSE